MNEDAREVFWTRQRFVLSGKLPAMEQWVRTTREVGRIRRLDIRLDYVVQGIGLGFETHEKQWQGVMDAIAQRFKLERLWLSIDAGNRLVAEGWKDLWMDENWWSYETGDGGWTWKNAWEVLVEPIVKATREEGRGGLKQFHFFLCHSYETEMTAERRVMGLQYDSGKEGKVPPGERLENDPHLKFSGLKWEHRRLGMELWMKHEAMERFL